MFAANPSLPIRPGAAIAKLPFGRRRSSLALCYSTLLYAGQGVESNESPGPASDRRRLGAATSRYSRLSNARRGFTYPQIADFEPSQGLHRVRFCRWGRPGARYVASIDGASESRFL